MPQIIPESHRDLLTGPILTVLTSLMADGRPQSTVVWTSFDGQIHVSISKSSQKYRNITRDPRVTLMTLDPKNPFRWIEIRGDVVNLSESEGVPHLDQLSQLYMGVHSYYGGVVPEEHRGKAVMVKISIEPVTVKTLG